MPGPPRGHQTQRVKDAVERDRRAWDLRVKYRMPLEQIARVLEREGYPLVQVPAISKAIRRAERRAQESFGRRVRTIRGVHLATLEHLYGAAMLAWARSCKEARLVRERTVNVAGPLLPTPVVPGQSPRPPVPGPPVLDRSETTNELRERVGDPRFLKLALDAVASIYAMFEVKPMPVDPQDPYARLPEDVAARLRAIDRDRQADVLAVLAGADPEDVDLGTSNGYNHGAAGE